MLEKLGFKERCYSSEIDKEKYLLVKFIILTFGIIGIVHTFWALQSINWDLSSGGIYALIIFITCILVSSYIVLRFFDRDNLKKCDIKQSKKVCYSSDTQRGRHMGLLTILLIVIIIGLSFATDTLIANAWNLSVVPYVFLVFLICCVSIPIIFIAMYRSIKLDDCKNIVKIL